MGDIQKSKHLKNPFSISLDYLRPTVRQIMGVLFKKGSIFKNEWTFLDFVYSLVVGDLAKPFFFL